MKTMEGTVLYVQESRFELQTPGGAGRLFVLSSRAAMEPQQLQALQRTQARIVVGYTEAEGVKVAVAHSVRAMADEVAAEAERS